MQLPAAEGEFLQAEEEFLCCPLGGLSSRLDCPFSLLIPQRPRARAGSIGPSRLLRLVQSFDSIREFPAASDIRPSLFFVHSANGPRLVQSPEARYGALLPPS